MFNIITSLIIGILVPIAGWVGYTEYAQEHTEPIEAVGGFSDPFISLQVGADPDNGDCLTTNGATSTWSATCGGGGSGELSDWQKVNSALTPTTTIGIRVNASSTIGNGTAQGGLTVFGTATSTNLNVTSITSALTLTGANGRFAEYTGTTCTNQFVRILSALGVATCEQVVTGDITDGTIVEADLNLNANTTGRVLQASSTAAGGWAWVATSTLGIDSSNWTDAGEYLYPSEVTDRLTIGTTTSFTNSVLTVAATSTGSTTIFKAVNTAKANLFTVNTSDVLIRGNATNTGVVKIGGSSSATDIESVAIGERADASGNSAMAIGPDSIATGNSAVAFGSDAAANGANAYAIGGFSEAVGTAALAVGNSAGAMSNRSFALGTSAFVDTNSVEAMAIGYNTIIDPNSEGSVLIGAAGNVDGATYATAIGWGANIGSGANGSIALGYQSVTTAVGQLAIGGSGLGITDVYIGESVTNTTPADVTIQTTGESGTNQNGVALILGGGKGTGSGQGGPLVFSTSAQGVSGTTLQTQTERARFNYLGYFGIGSTSPSRKLTVAGTSHFGGNVTATGTLQLTALSASRGLFLDSSSRATTTALSAALLNSLTDETGTGVAVFGTAPTFTTSITTPLINLDTNGVTIDTDDDGALSITGNSTGQDENLTVNLDDTANEATWTSTTGVTKWFLSGIGLRSNASSTIGNGTDVTGLTVFGNSTTTGTSTMKTAIIKGPSTASSTVYVYSTAAGFGGQVILEDTDAAGCTSIRTLNGVIVAATITCPKEY